MIRYIFIYGTNVNNLSYRFQKSHYKLAQTHCLYTAVSYWHSRFVSIRSDTTYLQQTKPSVLKAITREIFVPISECDAVFNLMSYWDSAFFAAWSWNLRFESRLRLIYVNVFVCLFIYLWFILRRFFSNQDYIASNDRVKSGWWIGMDSEGSGRGLIYVLSRRNCVFQYCIFMVKAWSSANPPPRTNNPNACLEDTVSQSWFWGSTR
jgi:hypothetical protein